MPRARGARPSLGAVRILAAIAAALAIGAIGAVVWLWQPWDDDADRVEEAELSEEFGGSACRRLAGVASRLAEEDPPPDAFLRALGRRAAGIRPPPRAFADLARGGRDLIPGKGFLARFDDGSAGQVRHFAGIAAAVSFGGARNTRRISIGVRRDPPDSADGRLTDEGIAFASAVLAGEVEVDEAPQWLLEHLCRRR